MLRGRHRCVAQSALSCNALLFDTAVALQWLACRDRPRGDAPVRIQEAGQPDGRRTLNVRLPTHANARELGVPRLDVPWLGAPTRVAERVATSREAARTHCDDSATGAE